MLDAHGGVIGIQVAIAQIKINVTDRAALQESGRHRARLQSPEIGDRTGPGVSPNASTHTCSRHDLLHGAHPLPRHASTAENGAINPVARTRTGSAQTDSSPSDQSQSPSAAWRLHLNQRSNRLARSLDPANTYQTRATEPAVVAIFSPRAIRINALHHLVSNSS